MSISLLGLLLFAGPTLYRAPLATQLPTTHGRPVWVFFTDKGFANEVEYLLALDRLSYLSRSLPYSTRLQPPDHTDLPVYEPYVRAVENLGARVRTVSRWLNAASFDLPEACLPQVSKLPFVYDLKLVSERTHSEPIEPLPVTGTRKVRSQSLDTAMARRFYGPSYDQAAMMGIPDLFFRGYYGSGVRLAIFDTGLKLKNNAVTGMRIADQHDFLSQDNFYTASGSSWNQQPADRLRFLGLVKDPCLEVQGRSALLAFVADSFAYGYSSPRRAVFISRSTDAGNSWSAAQPLVLSQPSSQVSSHTFENLRMGRMDSVVYLAYNELLSNFRARPEANSYLGFFVNDVWRPQIRVGTGRWPDFRIVRDTMYFCCVESDSSVLFRKASLTTIQPNWVVTKSIIVNQSFDDLRVTADTVGSVCIFGLDQHSGVVSVCRSTDAGATFSSPQPIAQNASGLHVTQLSGTLLLLVRGTRNPPLTRLSLFASTDQGLTWSERTPAADSLLTLGRFTAAANQAGFTALYESDGFIYRVTTTDKGLTWSTFRAVDTAGFCYQPALATAEPLLAAWVKRGDDNTAWEPGDSARFSPDQPDHGTRMASIISGYQPYSIVGVAPGVELLIAKTEFHKTAGGRYYEYNLEEDTYIQALEWAASRGADIVSTSLGYRGWYSDNQLDGKTAPISLAVGIAAKKGLVVVTAMGNRDTISYPWPKPYLTAPADAYGVIAVGGVQRNLLPWRGTGTGPTADGRTKPELVALSDTVAVVAPDSIYGLEGSVGTSCATALIAGACALLKEAHPSWNAESLKAVLFSSAGRAVPSCTFGYGVPRIDSAFKRFPPEPGVKGIPKDEIVPFPNPFYAGTPRMYFKLNLARPTPEAYISIYSSAGTLLDTIPLKAESASRPGRYEDVALLEQVGAYWGGRNASGELVASGLYLAVLHTTHGTTTAKFAIVR